MNPRTKQKKSAFDTLLNLLWDLKTENENSSNLSTAFLLTALIDFIWHKISPIRAFQYFKCLQLASQVVKIDLMVQNRATKNSSKPTPSWLYPAFGEANLQPGNWSEESQDISRFIRGLKYHIWLIFSHNTRRKNQLIIREKEQTNIYTHRAMRPIHFSPINFKKKK